MQFLRQERRHSMRSENTTSGNAHRHSRGNRGSWPRPWEAGTQPAPGLVAFVFVLCLSASPALGLGWGYGGSALAPRIEVVSSPADQVSGGDARVEIRILPWFSLDTVRVEVNGEDVTELFSPAASCWGVLEGVIADLPLGPSQIAASVPRRFGRWLPAMRTELEIVNHPRSGPMFSGPQQQPFLCSTEANDLGTPDADCGVPTRVEFLYLSTETDDWKPFDPTADPPADLARTTTLDGTEVDFIVRWEQGTINRFIYSIALLSPASQDPDAPDVSAWNRRLIYHFQGGVGIGHYQGDPSGSRMLYRYGLENGYAVAYSTGNKTGVHYNLQVGGETAIMVKDRFVTRYGRPDYTVGVGGSGGGIQQYVYGQNHPGLIDAAIPQYSYPDMVTQTIHIGDCELLERYMDLDVLDAAMQGEISEWTTWSGRTRLIGLNASDTETNPFVLLQPYLVSPGATECTNAWRGLAPLALNPNFGTAPGISPEDQLATEWTHPADLVNIYGTDADGFARNPWDNVGVQYGLAAVASGAITPEEFLHLNANVGTWMAPADMIQEGCPFVMSACFGDIDVWSARNMLLSPDGGVTPAPRRQGSPEAMQAAYESGMVFVGDFDIPAIDWRHYLEEQLDMHNSHQSFASRQRMLDRDGDAGNQVVWFTDARGTGSISDQTSLAFEVIDEWMANIRARPWRSVARNKPAGAVDRCFANDGTLLHEGPGVWDGILDDGPLGACAAAFPLYGTSRTVAGGPITDDVLKCHLQPVSSAVSRGLYGVWEPDTDDIARLEEIFPDGVCDYTLGDAGRP